MAELDFADDSASSDKFLESIRILHPLLSADVSIKLFQSMQTTVDSNIPCSVPVVFSPATVSPEDLELPTMLTTTHHEMLLSGIGATSQGIDCDELSRLLEHSDKWNLPLEQNYPSWKAPEDPSTEHKDLFPQAALGGIHSSTAKVPQAKLSWCNKKKQQDGAAANAEMLTLASSSAEQKAASSAHPQSAKVRRLGRSKSANDVKQIDSSGNSDAMDDDGGGKLSPDDENHVSKNLVSERKRRKKLNERLYSLRAIVPKISKMDKASIVGDAIGYVRDLQKQVEDIKAEISILQSDKDALQDGSPTVPGIAPSNGSELGLNMPEHKLLEFEVSQMEEQTYHLRIHGKRGPGAFVQLTRALEALDLEIINANLTSVNDRILNTLIVKVKSNEVVNIEALKSMIFGIFPKLGFQILL